MNTNFETPLPAPTVNALVQTHSEPRRSYTYETYAVDGVRVTLDARGRWECPCADFASGHECVHIDRAATFKKMRGVKRDDETVELSLTAQQLEILSQAAPPSPNDVRPTRRALHMSRWTAFAVAAAVSGVSSGLTYLASARPEVMPVAPSQYVAAAPEPVVQAEEPAPTPVRFVNPFDKSEVFEFPASTTEAAARQAVAELLMERARDRLAMDSTRHVRFARSR